MIQLSICMMVKNEESNLVRCLDSLEILKAELQSELIIIDTGSTDSTVNIAQKYTDKIYHHEWNHDFSEMRNKSIGYAKGNWILIIDADEELIDPQALISFVKANDRNFVAAALKLLNIANKKGEAGSALTTVRLFRNDGELRYEGSVHNIPFITGNVIELNSQIIHYGYISDDMDLMERKFLRTSALLLNELEKDPENIYYRFQLATTYDMYKDLDLSKVEYEKTYNLILKQNQKNLSTLYLWGPYCKTLIAKKEYSRAIEIAQEGLVLEPDHIDLHYFLGMAYFGIEDLDNGINQMIKYLEMLPNIKNLAISKNFSVQLYTLQSEEECRYNLSQAYCKKEEWDNVQVYSSWMINNTNESTEFFINSLNNYIKASIRLMKFEDVIELYHRYPVKRWIRLDEMVWSNISKYKLSEVVEGNNVYQLGSIPSMLGKVISMRINSETILEITNNNGNGNDFDDLLTISCDEALVLGIEKKYDFSSIFSKINESDMMTLLSAADEKYHDLANNIEKYLIIFEEMQIYSYLNLKRILYKYLMISSFGDEKYLTYMDKYFQNGINGLCFKYNADFLNSRLMNEFKNSEEQLLAIIYNLFNGAESEKIELVNHACLIFPEWSKSLLTWINNKINLDNVDSTKRHNDTEFEKLKEELVKNIDYLLGNNLFDDVASIITEFTKIYGVDETMQIKYDDALRKRSH